MQKYDPVSGLPLVSVRPIPQRRSWLAPLIVLPLLIGSAATAVFAHNAMHGRAESVEEAWAQVESNLQRRADLVPRLVEVVKRGLAHETQVLEGVARERSAPLAGMRAALERLGEAQTASRRALGSLGGASPTEAEGLAELWRREAELGRGVQVVLAIAEDYPDLRASDSLLELQAQLEGSENRINAARMAFNAAVRDYNAALVQLPTSLVAGARGFQRRPYFEASQEARLAQPLGLD